MGGLTYCPIINIGWANSGPEIMKKKKVHPSRYLWCFHTRARQRQDNDKTTTRQMLNLCIPMMPFTPTCLVTRLLSCRCLVVVLLWCKNTITLDVTLLASKKVVGPIAALKSGGGGR